MRLKRRPLSHRTYLIRVPASFQGKYTVPFQFQKLDGKWYLHECDKDHLLPSCPHLHCVENPLKMDIYEGRIYDVKKKEFSMRRIKELELKKLWASSIFVALVYRERERYQCLHKRDPVRYPKLPEIPEYANTRFYGSNKRHVRYGQLCRFMSRIT